MNSLRLTGLLGVALGGALLGCGPAALAVRAEENFWPAWVAETNARGHTTSWQAVGPLVGRQPAEEPGTVTGFRPWYAQWTAPDGTVRETDFLYPIFIYRSDGATYRWSVFQLINRGGELAARRASRPAALRDETFDVWPFWFSRRTGEPDTSYSALLPLGGKIKSRFGYDQLSFVLFPLFTRAEKRGVTTTATPFPFVRVTSGAARGFALWPLFGWRDDAGGSTQRFLLWPLGWDNLRYPPAGAPAGTPPMRQVGFLPLFTRESAAGYENVSYLWPFFGYTERTGPAHYHETRYFWPFLVQGDGAGRNVTRWAPFYTHSLKNGMDKTWVMWPLYRKKELNEGRVIETQRQFGYFLYRSIEERSVSNPRAAPAVHTDVWPLFSHWDNGAGRVQVQFPSIFEIFFPANERIHASWSPLLSFYRYNQRAPGDVRQEWFWGLVSWRHDRDGREFHLGPLYGLKERDGAKRVTIAGGLVGWQRRTPGGGWHSFWFDFRAKGNKLNASAR